MYNANYHRSGSRNRYNAGYRNPATPTSASFSALVEEKKARFIEANAEVCAWVEAKKNRFDFAGSLAGALNRYGCLTENQIAAVRRCMERDAQFDAERRVREENAPAVTVTAIERAFATA